MVCLAVGIGCGLAGCAPQEPAPEPEEPTATQETVSTVDLAFAPIEAKSGSSMQGVAVFENKDGKVKLSIELRDVSPGPHAVHIHETGDCSAPDGMSAGGHWNPSGAAHGKWGEPPFHLGDIGNLEVGEGGEGSLKLITELWTLGTGAENDVLGKAIVVHSGADDFATQPTGAAGKRIGCGVISADE
jgi:Cu-Zn family superoxide dismutase